MNVYEEEELSGKIKGKIWDLEEDKRFGKKRKVRNKLGQIDSVRRYVQVGREEK